MMVTFGASVKKRTRANPPLVIITDEEAKKIRLNPDLVISNPKPSDKKKVWRQLRRHLPPERAAAAFAKIFPNARRKLPGRKVPQEVIKELMKDPEFVEGCKKYEEFHGHKPDLSKLREIDIPQFEHDNDVYLIPLGKAPAVSYDASEMMPGSTKANAIYVHPFGEETGEQPTVAVTSDGELIIYLPGEYEVTDWVRG